jgi:nucleotide-binding universal stress UspA family protein
MWPEYKKILYATNLGLESPYVFRHALGISQRYDAKIHIIHVLEPLSDTVRGMVEFFLTEEQFKNKREKARKYQLERLHKRLASFCSEATCELESNVPDPVKHIEIKEGQPSETILSVAEKGGFDLIIMGTHRGVREGGAKLLGSTARRVVNNSKVPVLTVYTPDDKLEDPESR